MKNPSPIESQTFRPIDEAIDFNEDFCAPELLYETSGSKLYRVRKAGKYFLIKRPADDSGRGLELLKREYEISLGLSHPHVVGYFTYAAHTPVGAGIVLEYIDGRNLATWLSEQPTFEQRCRVFKQILEAVAYIHSCGIIHNDLKPDNILISNAHNDVKMIDLGLADDDAHYLLRQLGCTVRYASPELLSQGAIDCRSDIYSLGCIMEQIFGDRYRRIVRKCMAQNPADRYPNVDALCSAWQRRMNRCKVIGVGVFVALLMMLFGIGAISLYHNQSQISDMGADVERIREHAQIEKLICAECDAKAEKIYQEVRQVMDTARYFEFAFLSLGDFHARMNQLCEEVNPEGMEDNTLAVQVRSHLTSLRTHYYKALDEFVRTKPSYMHADISEQERTRLENAYLKEVRKMEETHY